MQIRVFSWLPPTNAAVSNNAKIWVVDADDNTTPQDATYQVTGSTADFILHGSLTYNGTLLDGQKIKGRHYGRHYLGHLW